MSELLEEELTYRIIGCAMKVHTEVGHGLREKTYERGLCVDFRHETIAFSQQKVYPVHYRGEKIDDYIPDLEVEDRVIVDTKTVEKINDEHRGQMLNYLKISGRQVGLILNFKHVKLEWERLVLEQNC